MITTTPSFTRGRASRWLHGELVRLEAQHPALHRRLLTLWRHPVLVVVLVAVVVEGSLGAVIPVGDAAWFRRAGTGMLGAGFLDVLSDQGLQIGPLYLLALGVATQVVTFLHLPVLFTLAALQVAGLAWLGMWTARRAAVATGAAFLPAQWAVGLTLALGGFLAESIGNGHPEELLVGLLLANAALLAARGRYALAGFVIALATGVKQWGVIGAGVLLSGRRLRGLLVGGVVLAVTVLAIYLPFVLGGDVRTFEMRWGFRSSTLLGRIGMWTGLSDWALRCLQGAVAGGVGALLAWQRRASPLLAVIGIVAARLLLDPMRLTYYSGPLVAVVLIWMWASRADVVRRWRIAVTAALPLLVLAPYLLPETLLWRGADVLLVLVPLVCLAVDRRTPADAPATTPATASREVGPDEVSSSAPDTLPPCPPTSSRPVAHVSS